ncbi:MAG: hypothetical protein P8182_15125 [Deltaproteobacteria bacterium]
MTGAEPAQKVADGCGFMKGEAAGIAETVLQRMNARRVAGDDVMISGAGT